MAVWSIINKSEGLSNKRIDSERYKPQYTENEYLLRNLPHKKLKYYINDISGGATPRGAKYSLSGIPFVRVQNIKDNYSDLNDVVYIHESIHNGELFRSQIKEDDVLLTITGVSYGNSTVAHKKMLPANMNQHSVRISLKNALLPEFLSTFFVSKYGKLQSDSKVTGDTRPALTYSEISNIIIPDIIIENQLRIKEIVNNATNLRILSQERYIQAIDLLEQELGLDRITFDKKKSYEASFSEVATTRRMNAEYFSPLVKNILSQSFLTNSKPIGALFQIVRGSSPKVYFGNGFPVIKTKNIRVPEIDRERVSDFVKTTKDLTTIQENDLLLASMGVGSLGRMSYILSLNEETVVDGTIRVFRRKSSTPINYEIPTLLFLSTKVGQELIYRGIVGSTGIISLPDDYLSKIPIPHFSEELCLDLTRLVKESMMAKRESKRLLEEAKTHVEQLIEEAANKN